MNILEKKIARKILEDYIKIMISVVSDYRIGTDMSVEQEEELREDFVEKLFTLTSKEMIEITKQTIKIADNLLKNHPHRGYLTLHLLENIIGWRPSKKYFKKYFPSKAGTKECINFDPKEEEILKSLILNLKKEIPKTEYHNIASLLEKITGDLINFYDEKYWNQFLVFELGYDKPNKYPLKIDRFEAKKACKGLRIYFLEGISILENRRGYEMLVRDDVGEFCVDLHCTKNNQNVVVQIEFWLSLDRKPSRTVLTEFGKKMLKIADDFHLKLYDRHFEKSFSTSNELIDFIMNSKVAKLHYNNLQ